MEMKIEEITLGKCIIDGDFKEVKGGCFQTLVKANNNDLESIILLEINPKQYKYLRTFNYKESNVYISGYMQVRKNKKDIPFLFIKATKVIKENKNYSKIKNKEYERIIKIKWNEEIKKFNYEVKELDVRHIKFINKEHIKRFQLTLSRKEIYKYNKSLNEFVKIAVKSIEGTDNYELILGWKYLILAKLFDKKVKCYIVDKSREELINQLCTKLEDNKEVYEK